MAGKRSSTTIRAAKTVSTPSSQAEEFATGIEAPCCETSKPELCDEQIRTLAYLKWEAAGCPNGDGVEFWVDAERELEDQACAVPKPHFLA